ncbi:DUF4860 domain-containing protein [Acutalibacter caecimuris]|uniref:DUF4860 domain-containing protein n=1 Tax=Acutalibacter caecimuris TaxID=3093657 RepID=UPI002AC90576|nr:DUF4860 domain-containing protein [Acutalibacter sp. M00118]
MKKTTVKHNLDGIAALLLFAVFAVCILMVLLTGADAYRRLTSRDNEAYAQRTGTQYLAQRVRQADVAGSVEIADFDGVPALQLRDGSENVTRIYVYDGWLMELYSDPANGLGPEAGEYIMEAQGLELDLDYNGCLRMRLTVDSVTDQIEISLRGGKEWRTW